VVHRARSRIRLVLIFLALAVELGVGASAAAAAPRLFLTDLQSGPSAGGEGNLGAFVTIWGEGFGAARGDSTVTVGGREVARYVTWGEDNAVARGLDMIVVHLGPAVASGDIVVTAAGEASNPLPFTVRPGSLFFVSRPAATTTTEASRNPGGR